MKQFLMIFAVFFLHQHFAQALDLSNCGRVIGHEMGLWEFFASPPGPEQVDRVLKSELKFVKISLRKLKDGIWVVNHDDAKTIYPSPGESKIVHLSQLTWTEVQEMKKLPGAVIPIYPLQDYINRDHGGLCWMFSPKVPIDANLISEILRLQISQRSVLLTTSLSEVEFLTSLPVEDNLHFTGRVGSHVQELDAFKAYLGKLWAIEIDPTQQAAALTSVAHTLGFKAYTDSMRYSWNYEFIHTACSKVFAMGSDYSQTNRPLQCLHEMGF